MPSIAGPSSPSAALVEALDSSARLVDRHLQDDRCFPDLSELLSVPSHNIPSLSGVSDMDYPLQGPGLLSVPNLPELSAVRRVPLPPELVEQFSHMQFNCMMGVFPEITRAWLTIDNDIFMWNYEDGGDVAYFDGLIETILAVGLVKPKQGILQPHIHYLLVLATSVDVVILGVSFPRVTHGGLNDSMSGGMQILPDHLFSIPTDNTYILTVTSTDLGRIFMAGKDGCLYEIAYQAEAGWLSQRCRKINHSKSSLSFLVPSVLQFSFSEDDPIVQIAVDNSRNTLFTRSEKGVLQVYDLGVDGRSMSRVATMSQNGIVAAAGNIARTMDRSVFKPIVQISVISRSESSDVHLLAVTHAGVRLYFCTTPFAPPQQRQTPARPSLLSLVHVRLPPGFSASSTVQKPAKVHKALHSKGILLMAASETEDNDILWCINHDSFPFKKPLMETQMMSNIDGHTWAISAINEEKPSRICTPLNKEMIPVTDSPVVVLQHNTPPQKFVLLSAKGSHIFQKLRPVDQLRHLLVSCAGGESEEIERFFKLHREEQACATALILACSNEACNREVSQWATRAFFRYGGEAQMRFPAAMSPPSNVGPMMSSPGPGIFPPPLATPYAPMHTGSAPITPMSVGPEVIFSGKHNGICVYFARVLGNIWDGSLAVEKAVSRGSQTFSILESSVTSFDLESVLLELYRLKEFLDKNSLFSPSSLGGASFSSPGNLQQRLLGFMRPDGASSQQVQQELQRKYHTKAQVYEKVSLQSIQALVHRSYQTLALWKLLCDHQFSLIMSELPKEFQEQMKAASFKDMIRGKELTGALVTALINVYIKDNTSVDVISNHLRDVCPLLYSTEDSVCSKANELLQNSKQIQNKVDKEKMLRESLRLYQKICQNTDLPVVCSQYRQVRFYEGALELCLTAADKKDPQRLGPHFYKNGEPEEDQTGQLAFQERLLCYKCITDTMQELVNQSKAAPQSPSVPKQPGPPVLTSDPNMLSNEEATAHFEQIFGLAQRSQDELFHIALYNWLIQADLADKLLEVNSPYLEEHLMHMIKQDQSKVHNMDLLWRYYEKNRNFGKAAHVLARLADMHSTEISLKQRLEYLARAILSAKSSSCISAQAADGEFLHELEEKMELVRIQVQIQDTLIRQYSSHPSVKNAVSQLDSDLMDITKLYGEYADHFKLSECKLAIIHCAGHSDPILVHSLWQEIIEKELADTVAMSTVDRMRSLSLKVVSLGRIYAGTPRYFPLEFLVKFLEQEVCRLNWDVGFVTSTMQEIGVQLPRLLEVYDQLFKTRDPYWQRLKKPLHLVECIHVLLSGYVDDPSRVPTYDRRRFANVCLDNICGYLVELQSLSPNAALQHTIGNFKSLQAKLDKLH
ncbi:nuclear pore complex protein Nup155 [Syngnathus acus]|uniref:nuclear pore complex protein Nup155 n=1 Tax=Syngnathus acus TaxID=161584 RepID=UPI00188635A1|nr:nuclear pore complex protein Nup155 [Syngnathus acus]XP_037120776.1 nuclear pore complex protein Nup155 [Syngnathus acus]